VEGFKALRSVCRSDLSLAGYLRQVGSSTQLSAGLEGPSAPPTPLHPHAMAKKKASTAKAKAKAEKKTRTAQKVEKKEKKKAGKSKLADEEDDSQDLEGVLDQVSFVTFFFRSAFDLGV